MISTQPLFFAKNPWLLAGSAVAAALFSAAVARLCQFAIWADASLRHAAPEKAVA